MQKNWYILYTKPKWEKKVACSLRKRKIDVYLPVNSKQIRSLRRVKTQEEPLFCTYVFANITPDDIIKIRSVEGVVNLVYWKSEPAKIDNKEMDMIKEFVSHYQEITLEKTKVNADAVPRLVDGTKYSFSWNILKIRNTFAKMNLPSMGYTLTATIGNPNDESTEFYFQKNPQLSKS